MSLSENDNSFRPSQWSSLWSKAESNISLSNKVIPKTFPKQETREEEPELKEVFPRIERPPFTEYEPDTRLANWKRWLDIHKKQQDKLSNILNRPPQCLLMNMNYNDLYVNQQKRCITEAYSYEFGDKYRGHPCFWNTDSGAHSETKRLGIYQPIQKRYDRSHPTAHVNWCPPPTELEYVTVPGVIMNEKGLSGEPCLPLPKVNWDMSHYVSKKKEDLKEKIDLFQEHTPQAEELAVVGSKLTRTDESRVVNFELEKLSEVSHDDISSSSISEKSESSIMQSISAAIDGEIVDNSLKVWTVYFGDCLTKELSEKCLTIQNLSDCCVRYSWESILPSWVKSPLPLKQVRNRKTFHFNKNDAVILPRSEGTLKFYFESGTAGVFHEKWKLHLSNEPDKDEIITVELQAVVDESSETEDSLKIIDSYIESCIRYTIASKTVKEILERSRPERPAILPYDWMFFEEQIFLYNNPDLFYESKYVSLLKEMYKRVSEGPWDLSAQTLRKKLLEKALSEDITETMNEFTAIVCHLMKPKLNLSFTNEKHKSVYELLCCFIDKMENESNSLKFIFKIPLTIASSLNIGDVEMSVKTSRNSKFNAKESIISKKSNKKKSQTQTRFSVEKTSSAMLEDTTLLRQTLTIGDSSATMSYELEEKMRKQEYLDALYIKTYHHLCVTIDNIGAVIESFDVQKKKSALVSLKTNILYNSFN